MSTTISIQEKGTASGVHTILLGGGTLFGGIETSNVMSTNNLSTYTTQAGQMAYFPYVPSNTFTSTSLSFNVINAVAGSLAKLCIYSHDGINAPQDRLYESTDINLSTSGNKTISTSFTFTKGKVYWFGILSNVFSSQISAMTSGAMPIGFIGTTMISSLADVALTYSNGAPITATPNSYLSNAPVIRLR